MLNKVIFDNNPSDWILSDNCAIRCAGPAYNYRYPASYISHFISYYYIYLITKTIDARRFETSIDYNGGNTSCSNKLISIACLQ